MTSEINVIIAIVNKNKLIPTKQRSPYTDRTGDGWVVGMLSNRPLIPSSGWGSGAKLSLLRFSKWQPDRFTNDRNGQYLDNSTLPTSYLCIYFLFFLKTRMVISYFLFFQFRQLAQQAMNGGHCSFDIPCGKQCVSISARDSSR